jgi:hypothetical protein
MPRSRQRCVYRILTIRFPRSTTVDQLVEQLGLTPEDVGGEAGRLRRTEMSSSATIFQLWLEPDRADRFLNEVEAGGPVITSQNFLSPPSESPGQWLRRQYRSALALTQLRLRRHLPTSLRRPRLSSDELGRQIMEQALAGVSLQERDRQTAIALTTVICSRRFDELLGLSSMLSETP